jgi:predicted ATPase
MLFTDVEGSTRLAQELGPAWPEVLTEHRHLMREAIAKAGGYIEGTEGDSFFATFASPGSALDAAINAQRGLRAHAWPEAVGELRVRMGLHTGDVEHTDGHYVGLEVHRGARVGAVSSGGQVLMTEAVRGLFGPSVPAEDLGWHRLKDFPDPIHLYHLVVDEDRPAEAFPPPRTLDVRPNNLPPTDRPMVGRTNELKTIAAAFIDEEARLVTLTGLGGVGKTITALAAARALLDTFTGGVWLVRAEALRNTQELLQAAAAAMHVRDVPGTDLFDAISARLETGRYLLVLDNLEHLADAGALVKRLLDCAPGMAILTTSRAPLRLASERTIILGAMAADEALSMFMSRAQQVDPSLTLADRETRNAVEQLCDRLGALPLALELAAARLRLMTPRQLLDRLGSALDLRGAEADRPDRHRSIRATIEWTLELLTPDASTLFTRIGIFLGAAPLDVIEQVCGEGIDAVEAAAVLVDYSLLRRSGTGLELVEALREVAVERLAASGEIEALRRRHAEAMIVLSRAVRSASTAPQHAMETVERLLPDTWAAARWARANEPLMQCALASNLSTFWAMKGSLRATLEEVDAALAREELDATARGELTLNKAHLLLVAGRPADGLAAAEEGLELLSDRSDLDRGGDLTTVAQAQMVAGLFEEGVATAREALMHHRRSGSGERTVLGLVVLAQGLLLSGLTAEAGPMLDEAEEIARGMDTFVALGIENARADWALASGDPHRALAGYARNLSSTMAGFGQFVFYDVAGIAIALEKAGEPDPALEVGALVVAAAADWGTTADAFSFLEGGVPAAMARARAVLPADWAQAAEARGRVVAPGARPGHALAIAREVLERLGVS